MDPDVGAVFELVQLSFMPGLLAAISIAIDIDLFDSGDSVWQLKDVAARKDVDPILLKRIMRVLCSYRIFAPIDQHQYGPTPTSRALALPPVRDFLRFQSVPLDEKFDTWLPVVQKLPEYLQSTSYRNLDGTSQSLGKTVLGHEFFDYLHRNPEKLKRFDSAMKISDQAPPFTIPVFPYMEQAVLAAADGQEQPLFLDVGGGRGQYVERLLMEIPDIPCEFIVQDLEPTTATLDTTSPKIKGAVHDFFEPQSVKGARWYHFRRVFHDWPDTACRKILANTHEAMRKEYSTLLIQDLVIPEKDCSQVEALIDFGIMVASAGMERTEEQWRELLSAEGFQIIKIWPSQVGSLCIIEAEAI